MTINDVTWFTLQRPFELDGLLTYLTNKPIRTVIELGVAWGGTARIWAEMVAPHDGVVYAVDLFHNEAAPGWKARLRHRSGADQDFVLPCAYKGQPCEKHIREIRGNTHDPEVRKQLQGVQADLLFVDGDHANDGCLRDLVDYSPLVRPGGLIVIHDIINHTPPGCCVPDVWKYLYRHPEAISFIDPFPADVYGHQGEFWHPANVGLGIGVVPRDQTYDAILKVLGLPLPSATNRIAAWPGTRLDEPPMEMRVHEDFCGGLADLIQLLPPSTEMVEIGSYSGESSAMFADKVRLVVCVDVWRTHYNPNEPKVEAIYGGPRSERIFDVRMNRFERVVKLKLPSEEAATLFPDRRFDFAYVDGHHTEPALRTDIETWLPKIRETGAIGGHDLGNGHPDVERVVYELLGESPRRFRDYSWYFTMAEVRAHRQARGLPI